MTRGQWVFRMGVIGLALVVIQVSSSGASSGDRASKKASLPPAVAKAIDDNRPGAEIDKLDVEKEHGIRFYDIEFKGNRGEMDVAEDGTVLDVATVIDLKDVPEPAAEAIRRAAGRNPIKRVERSEVRAEIGTQDGRSIISRLAAPKYVYEAELERGEIEVAADGRVIKGPK
jgi:hypothetical protein